jgi:uncharacterized protein
MTATVSLAQARRIALAAQGFADPLPGGGRVTRRHLLRVVDRVQVVQIDSVNVVARSHYLPFLSRLGPYDRSLLDGLRDGRAGGRPRPRGLVEHWAHEASLIPPRTWPWLGFRMRGPRVDASTAGIRARHPGLLEAVEEVVHAHGPLTAREVEVHLPHGAGSRREHWGWNWSAVKVCLEHLFRVGAVTSAGRTAQFERRYAPLTQVLPPEVVAMAPGAPDAPDDLTCAVELMRRAVRAHGIGTELCLRDYFRLGAAAGRQALQVLERAGEVEAVRIQGWDQPAYLDVAARRPRSVPGRALLSPFDSLVWQRQRTERLFGFHYRLEIYVPAARRVHGYYVLPFLLDEQLVGRVDLKADRATGMLVVRAVHLEASAPSHSVDELRAELASTARWLGLEHVAMP